jgi:glycerate kinase
MGHTPGEWRRGKIPTTVVSDSSEGLDVLGSTGDQAVSYFGGNLIAESVSPNNVPIIAAAPKMKKDIEELSAALLAAFLVLTSQETSIEKQADAISMARSALWNAKVFRRKENSNENR